MSAQTFKDTQREFAAYLRDPEKSVPPENIESRRLKIYSDLIFNNIDGFLQGAFPILHSLFNEEDWKKLVRDFIRDYRAHSPYFLEISEEFLNYLQQGRTNKNDLPFLLELAHYEWVELALDISTEEFPVSEPVDNWLEVAPRVSPLAWNLSYQFPVHKIGPEYQPAEPGETPTFLIVYRNAKDEVHFMESNAATSRLLALLSGDQPMQTAEALNQLATELNAPDVRAIHQFGLDLIQRLADLNVICGAR